VIKPLNNYVVLQKIEEKTKKKDKSTILIPDTFQSDTRPTEKFKTFKLAAIGNCCRILSGDDIGKKVLVIQNSIDKIKVEEQEDLFLLSETYVVGIIE